MIRISAWRSIDLSKISTPNTQNLLPLFLHCAKHFKILVLGQFIAAVIWAIDLSFRPYLLKVMLDRVVKIDPNSVLDLLALPASLYVTMLFINAFISRFEQFIWLNLNPGMKSYVALVLMDKVINHPFTFYQNNFAGSLASKIKDVMSGMPDLTRILVYKLFSHLLALLISIYTIWQAKPIFAFTLIPWILIYLTGSLKFSVRAKKLTDTSGDIRSIAVGYIADVLSNIVNVWLFNTKKWEQKGKLSSILQEYVKADQARDWCFIRMYIFQSLSFIFYQMVCFVWLITSLRNQTITPGDFALVITLNIAIVGCLSDLSNDISTCADIIGNITQGLRSTNSLESLQDKLPTKELIIKEGNVSFNNVHFRYKDSNPLFKGLSIQLWGGQKVGLVGQSGGGKSTFVNLILRLFNIDRGSIQIDNQDIYDVTLESLRKNIALIPQDPSLFHRSLMENIRYGNIEATDEQVIEASKRAYIHEYIISLPQGYKSLVGERGIKLSGGQRQRIAIARAILKNAPILILDEATSHLDSITENHIQKSLLDLMRNKTTIVIAHRLSTLLHMDRILVFSQGEIVEKGKHQDLLNKGGLYKKLWDAQVGGFLGDFIF